MRTVGASYIYRQSPGAEKVGGLELRLRRRAGDAGVIDVAADAWLDPGVDADVAPYAAEARRGIETAAAEAGVDLAEFDIAMARFALHPVDSRPQAYFNAARYAFRAAYDAWRRP